MQTSHKPQFDFVRWRWHALILSTLIVIAGLYIVGTKGLKKGVDFEGGTVVILAFEQPPNYDRIREALAGDTIVQRYGPEANNHVMIRVKRTGHETGLDLAQEAKAIVQTLKGANVGAFSDTPVGTKIVGPVVGEQLRRQGLMATVLAMAGILAYIALRFQFSFAVGAIVATLHDLLVTMAFLTFFNYDLTLNVIAGLLTITGYSVNDTIVIFDRVRENMRSMRRDDLKSIINTAVNQTLSRTIITAGTTLLSVIALYLFGGEVLEGFAFTMLVGIISGTYSTVFIAASLAIVFQGKRPMKGQASPATAAAPATRPSRRRAS